MADGGAFDVAFPRRLESPIAYNPGESDAIAEAWLRRLTNGNLPEGQLPPDQEAVRAHWIDFLVGRILDKKDTVIVLDGEPGEGKSALGRELQLGVRNSLNAALGISVPFNLETDIPYRLSYFIHRVWLSSIASPAVIMADETELIGGQARAGSDEKGALLDRVLSVCRIKAATAFMLSPNIRGISSAVRDRRAKLWMHIEYRGEATVFELQKAINFKRPGPLPFMKAPGPWSHLGWSNPEGEKGWAEYERWKLDNANRFLLRAIYQAVALERKDGLVDPPWLSELPEPERRAASVDRKYTPEYRAASRLRAAKSYARKKRAQKAQKRASLRTRTRARA